MACSSLAKISGKKTVYGGMSFGDCVVQFLIGTPSSKMDRGTLGQIATVQLLFSGVDASPLLPPYGMTRRMRLLSLLRSARFLYQPIVIWDSSSVQLALYLVFEAFSQSSSIAVGGGVP